MKYRTVPGTRLKVSEVGFGVWSLAYGCRDPEHEEKAHQLLRYALDRGVNFFETADSCAGGYGERLIGDALHDERDRIVIATKFGHDFYPHATAPDLLRDPVERMNFSPRFVRFACDESLRRLRTDHIDFYQIHHPTMGVVVRDDLFLVLEKLRHQGKILAWGAALGPDYSWIEEGKLLMRLGRASNLRIAFSLLDPDPGWELLEESGQWNVGLFAAMPYLSREWFREHAEVLAAFRFLARDQGRSLLQAALKFVLSHRGILSAVADIDQESQINEFAVISECPDLTREELGQIRELYRRRAFAPLHG